MKTDMGKRFLVTGSSGFIGKHLVKALREQKLEYPNIVDEFDLPDGDVTSVESLQRKFQHQPDAVIHLAAINGTKNFYERPNEVLDVGVNGISNVLNLCRMWKVKEFFLASSSEVYHNPQIMPTPENVPLIVPDPLNPRYSYSASKIISEVMTFNYGREYFDRVCVFRPHNVYGIPNLSSDHVIPQLITRIGDHLKARPEDDNITVDIQGTGYETRSFCYISDAIDQILCIVDKGEHLGIYNVGNYSEINTPRLTRMIGDCFHKRVNARPSSVTREGSPYQRCPNIWKVSALLGHSPEVPLSEGLQMMVDYYLEQNK